ncbi:unnamed protein product [Enterobius vermicularis]|uniref:Uncharacterized protein n=1 Tax=Enterobius vermicularis TaxID=51028 RepID=A0A0N4VA90_ENTVE|nr:unnamed protein product [Enterobius vermicularis]
MSKQSSETSEYEIAYRSTIQPRTAVRTQTRQSGGFQPISDDRLTVPTVPEFYCMLLDFGM